MHQLKIVDRETGEIFLWKKFLHSQWLYQVHCQTKKNSDGPSLYCAVIVKKVDSKTRSKTSINDLLRD